MVHAVLFDLFETLVTETGAPVTRASQLAAALGVPEDAYRRQWRPRRIEIVLGRRSFRDVLDEIARNLGRTPDEGLLEQLRSERVRQKTAVLRAVEPDVVAAVGALRAQGVKLVVVSNAFAEDVAGWRTSPLRSFFDLTFFSCEIGLAKPDPAIYRLACRELQVLPSQALFIGDGGDDELGGASAAGIRARRALWFVPGQAHAAAARDDAALTRATDVLHAALTG